jgi:thiol-disulfide isomerase/thioredoxin
MSIHRPKIISRRGFNRMALSSLIGASGVAAGMINPAFAALDTMKPLDRASPDTPLVDNDGKTAPLSARADRPLLVNLWASWCPPCVHELPALQRLDAALQSEGMAVMLIGLDRKGRDFSAQFLADQGISIPRSTYEKTGDFPRQMEVRVMPTSFFIRPGGRIIGVIEGPLEWDKPNVIAAVKQILQS